MVIVHYFSWVFPQFQECFLEVTSTQVKHVGQCTGMSIRKYEMHCRAQFDFMQCKHTFLWLFLKSCCGNSSYKLEFIFLLHVINLLVKKKKKKKISFHIDYHPRSQLCDADELPRALFADARSWRAKQDVRSSRSNSEAALKEKTCPAQPDSCSSTSLLVRHANERGHKKEGLRNMPKISVPRKMIESRECTLSWMPAPAQRQAYLSLALPVLLLFCPTCF